MQVTGVPDGVHVEKPPEYETCIIQPPSYDDALQQLSPADLLADARKLEKLSPVPGSEDDTLAVVTVNTAAANAVASADAVPSAGHRGTINVYHVTCSSAPSALRADR